MKKTAKSSKTKLTLTTTPRFSPIVTPAQSRSRQYTAQLGQLWSASTTLTKNGWQQAAHFINIRDKRTGRKALSAYGAYIFINRVLLSCGQSPLLSAPQTFIAPLGLPYNLAMDAATTPAADANGFGTFALKLTATGYPNFVQLYAAKASLADKPVRPASGFTLIGYLDSIPNGGLDIADLYLSKFGMPTPGAQVAVQVVAVSPTGLRGAPMLLQAVTDAPAADHPADAHELKKAA